MTLKSLSGLLAGQKHPFEPESRDLCPMTLKEILALALGAVIVHEYPRLREWIIRKTRPRPRPIVVVGSANRAFSRPYD